MLASPVRFLLAAASFCVCTTASAAQLECVTAPDGQAKLFTDIETRDLSQLEQYLRYLLEHCGADSREHHLPAIVNALAEGGDEEAFVAARALKSLKDPWEVPELEDIVKTIHQRFEPKRQEAILASNASTDFSEPFSLPLALREIDAALANARSYYRSAIITRLSDEESFGLVVSYLKNAQTLTTSEYALNAAVLEADTYVQSYLLDIQPHEDQLRKAVAKYSETLEDEFLSGFVNGWRWKNDLRLRRAMASFVLGDFEECRRDLVALRDWQPEIEMHDLSKPVSVSVRHLIGLNPPYIDQVYVHRFFPGLGHSVREHYATREFAAYALEHVNSHVVEAGQISRPTSTEEIERFDGYLRRFQNSDHTLVLLSRQSESDAREALFQLRVQLEPHLADIKSILPEFDASGDLELLEPRSGSSWGVTIRPDLTEGQVVQLMQLFRRIGIGERPFVLRPQVL